MFDFATAGRVLVGAGRVAEVPAVLGLLGTRRVLVITGSRPDRHTALLESLGGVADEAVVITCPGEPTVNDAVLARSAAREAASDVVLAVGGGSVLDLGKAVAALVAADNPLDHLEVIGRGLPLPSGGLPLVAVPTTAGSGAEVTANAVLASPDHHVKVSLRSPRLLPRVAIVDPEMTYDCPASVTAHSGLDALTQCLEPFVSVKATPVTDGLAREGLRLAGTGLRAAVVDGRDVGARHDMAVCSLLGGMALANAKLGVVHGFAGVLGGRVPAPHGALCAALLGPTIEANLKALAQRDPGSVALERFAEAGDLLNGRSGAGTDGLLSWVRETVADLHVPALSAYGLTPEDADSAVAGTLRAGSTAGNPIHLTPDELHGIFAAAL